MNYGIPNPEPQPVIGPGANIRKLAESGHPIPARPAHLCITAPEYRASQRSECAGKELSDEELEAIMLAKEEARLQRELERDRAFLERIDRERRDAAERDERSRFVQRRRKWDDWIKDPSATDWALVMHSIRGMKRMTERQFASELQSTQATISRIERGKCRPHMKLILKLREIDQGSVYQKLFA